MPAIWIMALLILSSSTHAEVIVGRAVFIPDGDTICLQDEKTNEFVKVRIQGLDAPEKEQEFGMASRDVLRDVIGDQKVQVHFEKRDQYGRVIGVVYTGLKNAVSCINEDSSMHSGLQINEYMLCQGAAWYFKKFRRSYPKDLRRKWASAFNQARQTQKGLWQAEWPQTPWNWRKRNRTEPSSCPPENF